MILHILPNFNFVFSFFFFYLLGSHLHLILAVIVAVLCFTPNWLLTLKLCKDLRVSVYFLGEIKPENSKENYVIRMSQFVSNYVSGR